MEGLRDDHYQMLKEGSGISDDVIRERGYRTVTNKSELIELGFKDYQARVPSLLIPVHGPSGEIVGHHIRPDKPRVVKGKPKKYEFPEGCRNRLDVPPSVRNKIGDPSISLWFTEGSKKADSAASRGICCVALIGVWNFRGKNEKGGSVVIGDFEHVALEGRTVFIAYDSDAVDKEEVRNAEERLAGLLRSRGVKVQIVRIPPGPNGEKVGLDDYFVAGGTVEALLASASPPGPIEKDKEKSLTELLMGAAVELWHDSDHIAYASYKSKGVLFHAKARSQVFERYCRGVAYKATKRSPSNESLQTALATLAAKAEFEGKQHLVAVRIAWTTDRV